MAAMDRRLLEALRMLRSGDFVYGVCCRNLLSNYPHE